MLMKFEYSFSLVCGLLEVLLFCPPPLFFFWHKKPRKKSAEETPLQTHTALVRCSWLWKEQTGKVMVNRSLLKAVPAL